MRAAIGHAASLGMAYSMNLMLRPTQSGRGDALKGAADEDGQAPGGGTYRRKGRRAGDLQECVAWTAQNARPTPISAASARRHRVDERISVLTSPETPSGWRSLWYPLTCRCAPLVGSSCGRFQVARLGSVFAASAIRRRVVVLPTKKSTGGLNL